MKKELFINHVIKRGARIIPIKDPNFSETMLNAFRKLKGFTKYIDFNCQINEDGGCKELTLSTRCCCSNCHDNAGFFRIMIDKDISAYAKKFTKLGFYRESKGCILPREMRSTTCLTTHCNHHPKDPFSFGMSHYRDKLENFRNKI